jgi:hypothetical protein
MTPNSRTATRVTGNEPLKQPTPINPSTKPRVSWFVVSATLVATTGAR